MLIVDRFEGEYAVCEDSETLRTRNIPKVLLPKGLQEGDCILQQGDNYVIDGAETLRRRQKARELLEKLY